MCFCILPNSSKPFLKGGKQWYDGLYSLPNIWFAFVTTTDHWDDNFIELLQDQYLITVLRDHRFVYKVKVVMFFHVCHFTCLYIEFHLLFYYTVQ